LNRYVNSLVFPDIVNGGLADTATSKDRRSKNFQSPVPMPPLLAIAIEKPHDDVDAGSSIDFRLASDGIVDTSTGTSA
jgi:hypothetical protein